MKTSPDPKRKERAGFSPARGAKAVRPKSPLMSSEERFRDTLDGMIEGCMLIGFDWSYLYVNEAAARYSHQAGEWNQSTELFVGTIPSAMTCESKLIRPRPAPFRGMRITQWQLSFTASSRRC
jgi:hypothetical protein